ncbi:MAG TPA: hypothetical protein VEB68_03000 [Croceibacterium sp.]|nr:hypothetical protein [Croceibacterium sp.]
MRIDKLASCLAAALLLGACQPEAADEAVAGQAADESFTEVLQDAAEAGAAGDDSTRPYDGIARDETLHFTGTEPFWGGEVTGVTLTYKTPEKPGGEVIAIERFAGRGGIAFSGLLAGADFEMMVTPLECSDGMSDRTYPFTVTLQIGEDMRNGCGWTERQPFAGPAHP